MLTSLSNQRLAVALVATLAAIAGCGASPADDAADDDLLVDADEAALQTAHDRAVIGVRFKNLPTLGANHVYEGWLIVGGKPLSAGRFALARPSAALYFSGPRAVLDAATRYVLTIERKVGDAPGPSGVKVLAGDLARGYARAHARLTVREAFDTDFTAASGGYILATPSTPAMDDYALGVWFVKSGAPSLTLPTLPAGWVYEGWIASQQGAVSTGRFKTAAGADSDGAGPAAGPNAGPPFPGQDFIRPPTNLIGGRVVVTVEPEDDDSPTPFAIKPLIDANIEDVGQGVIQTLENQAQATNPVGVAVIF
jgi:hypothetical protein